MDKRNKLINKLKKKKKIFDFLTEHLVDIKSCAFLLTSLTLFIVRLVNGGVGVVGSFAGGVVILDYLIENITHYGSDLCFAISEKLKEKIDNIGNEEKVEKLQEEQTLKANMSLSQNKTKLANNVIYKKILNKNEEQEVEKE